MLGAAKRTRWPDVTAESRTARATAQQPGLSRRAHRRQEQRRGIRDAVGARSVRPRAPRCRSRGRRGGRSRRAPARRAGHRRRRSGAQLPRAARRAEATRGRAREPRVSARDARADEDALRPRPRHAARRVERAGAILAPRRPRFPPLVAAETVAANRLAVLLGLRPGALAEELAPREIAPHLTTLAVGAPEELLKRRPDIRAAERELAAATARVGLAKADLFPRLTLTGFIGFIAGDASDLGESQSRAWSLTPALSWAGFGSGGRARVAAAEARTDAALATYESTVLRALEETENAFADLRSATPAPVRRRRAGRGVAGSGRARARAVSRRRRRLSAPARRGAHVAPGRGRVGRR